MPDIAFDSETHRFHAGNMTPKVVCGSWATKGECGLLLREDYFDALEASLDAGDEIIGAHIAYDFGCACAGRPRLLPKVFKAYDEGRVFDILIAEALHDIYYGMLFRDPETRQPFERYYLSLLEKRLLGIDRSPEKIGPNAWRERYGELDGVPFSLWAPEAKKYPLDDARNTFDVAAAQKRRPENLHCVAEQSRAAWALHLSSVWGIRTDPKVVAEVVAEVRAAHEVSLARFAAVGFYRADGTKNTAAVARRVAEAYGATEVCGACSGTGKMPSKKTGKLVNCDDCAGSGLKLDGVPLTATGRVSTDRDTLQESGDEELEHLAESGENEKWYSTYLPVIQLGTQVPINAETNVLVATGRTSYRKPNLQNLPRGGRIRETFYARPGKLLFSVDYGGLELVTLAQVCLWWVGHSRMAEALNAGRDLHAQFGASLLNITYEEMKDRLKKKDKVAKNFRQMSKCFHPDTETLVKGKGWVRIGELATNDLVAAAIPGGPGEGVKLEWQQPTSLIRFRHSEGLVHLKNEGMDLRVTPDHRMLVRRQGGQYAVVVPADVPKSREWMNAGVMDGSVSVDERLLRLAVATQADGNYLGKQIRFGFSKQRKIDRLKSLLRKGEYTEASYTNGKVAKKTTMITVRPALSLEVKDLLDGKQLPWQWLSLTKECREIILDEVRHWDGSKRGNWRMSHYYSTQKQSVDVLQAIAAITGRKTRAVWDAKWSVNPMWSNCCRLTIRAAGRDCSRGGELQVSEIPYDGDVVCLSVPSSFVLVRDGGVPVITGQCANFGYPGGLGGEMMVAYARQAYGARLCELSGRAEKCGVKKAQARDGRPICVECRATAYDLRESWFAQWPEVEEYHAIVKTLVEDASCGRVEVPGLEPDPGPGLTRGDVGFCDGANNGFQGLAARGAKAAYYAVTRECYTDRESVLWGTRPLVFIHDEILGETPVDRAHAAAHRVSEIMIATMRRYTPDVRVTAPPALMGHWFKGADPVYQCPTHGKAGEEACCAEARLVPWEPKK